MKRPVREFHHQYDNNSRRPYPYNGHHGLGASHRGEDVESGEIITSTSSHSSSHPAPGHHTSGHTSGHNNGPRPFHGGHGERRPRVYPNSNFSGNRGNGGFANSRGGHIGGHIGGGQASGPLISHAPQISHSHSPVPHTSPPVFSAYSMASSIPEYTMIIRKTQHGWQFLASIEDSPYWFLPKTDKDSYAMACRDVTPMILTFLHDRSRQQAAVYIATDENARAPWRSVQKPTRRSIVPLRDWIYFSEVFVQLDKHATDQSSSTSSSSHVSTPAVWNRLVHRSMVFIIQDLLIRFLGIEDVPKDKPLVLYHGTSLDAVKHIMAKGFEIPACKCDGGVQETTEIKSNKLFDFKDTFDVKATSHECVCRMMGKGVYGCSFYRASKFAQSKFGKKACVLRFVVHKSVNFYTVQREDTCSCPCEQSFVDHCGKLIEKHGAVHLKNDSLPATTSPEWVIGDPSKCFPINYIYFPPRMTPTGEEQRDDCDSIVSGEIREATESAGFVDSPAPVSRRAPREYKEPVSTGYGDDEDEDAGYQARFGGMRN